MNAWNRSFRPARMPSGMPISSDSSDRRERQAQRVDALVPQAERAEARRNPVRARSASLQPPIAEPDDAGRADDADPADAVEDGDAHLDELRR